MSRVNRVVAYRCPHCHQQIQPTPIYTIPFSQQHPPRRYQY